MAFTADTDERVRYLRDLSHAPLAVIFEYK